MGFPDGASGKEPACKCRRCKSHGFDPWIRKIAWRRKMATHSSILGWRIPMDRGSWWATVHRVAKKSDKTEVTEHSRVHIPNLALLSLKFFILLWIACVHIINLIFSC